MAAIKVALKFPLVATCGVCGGELRIYPYPAPAGSGFCAKCSPSWLEDFLKHATEATRKNGWRATE